VSETAARAVVAAVAVAMIAWLAVMERDARLQASGMTAARHLDVPGSAERSERDFRDARLINPDSAPDLGLAFLYRATGRQDEAIAVLDDIVRREPDNLTAWGALATFARDRDPDAVARAFAARERLDPLNARPR
jgi:hypothetical protein